MVNRHSDYHKKLEAAGHVLILDEHEEIDIFVLEFDTHNGPGCSFCEEVWCHHCKDEILPCRGSKE